MAVQINYDFYDENGSWHRNNIFTVATSTNTCFVALDVYSVVGTGSLTTISRGFKAFITNKNNTNNWNSITNVNSEVAYLRNLFELTSSQGLTASYNGWGRSVAVGNIYSLYPQNVTFIINSITKTDDYQYWLFVGDGLMDYFGTVPEDKTFVQTFHRPNSANVLYGLSSNVDLTQYSPSNIKSVMNNDYGTYNEVDQMPWVVRDMINRGWTTEQLPELDYNYNPTTIKYDIKINTITSKMDGVVEFNKRIIFEPYEDDKHLVNYTTTEGGVPIAQPLPYPMYKGNETIYEVELLTLSYDDNRVISKETVCRMNKPSIFALNKIDVTNLIKNTSEYVEFTRNGTPMSNYRFALNFKSIRRNWYIEVKFSVGFNIFEFYQRYSDTINFESYYLYPNNNVSFDYTLPVDGINSENNITLDKEFYAKTILNIEYVADKKEPIDTGFNPPKPPDPIPPDDLDDTPPTPDDTGEIPEPIPPVPPVPVPNPTLGTSGLYKIYELSLLDISNLGSFLWDTDWYENLKLINNTPLENILWLKQCAFNFPESETQDVKLGNVDTGIDAPIITSNFVQIVGTFTLPQKYNNFLDLAPFTTYQMYLPFVGVVDLDPNLTVGHTLTLNVFVECTSMIAKYQLTNEKNIIIGEWEFDSAITLPLSASNKAQQHFNQMTNVIRGIGETALNAVAGNVVGAVGSAIDGVASALTNQFHTSTSGTMTSNTAMMTNRMAYVIITRPMAQATPKFNHTYGRMANYTADLSTLNGFTIIDSNTDLSGFNCTNDEMELIRAELSEGVYI